MPVSRSLAEGTTADGEIEQKAAVSFSLLLLVLVSRSISPLYVWRGEGYCLPSSFPLPPFCVSLVLSFRGEKRMEDKSSAKTKKEEKAAACDVQSDWQCVVCVYECVCGLMRRVAMSDAPPHLMPQPPFSLPFLPSSLPSPPSPCFHWGFCSSPSLPSASSSGSRWWNYVTERSRGSGCTERASACFQCPSLPPQTV